MAVTLSTQDMVVILKGMIAIISKKSPRAILHNVHVKLQNGKATFRATDLERNLEISVDTECDDNIEFLIDPSIISRIFTKLVKREVYHVELNVKDGFWITKVEGKTKREYKFRILTAAADYPLAPDCIFKGFTIGYNKWKESIGKILPSVAKDKGRYALNGMLLESKTSGRIIFVGTDAKRLAIHKQKITGKKKLKEQQAILTTGFIKMVEKLSEKDELIKIGYEQNTGKPPESMLMKIQRNHMTISLICKTVKGNFPRWRDILPKNPPSTLHLDYEQMKNAIDDLFDYRTEEVAGSIFKINEPSKTLLMKHEKQKAEGGDSIAIQVPINRLVGENEDRVSFDTIFLADFFKVLKGEETIIFEMFGKKVPSLFYNEDKSFTYLLSPVNLE